MSAFAQTIAPIKTGDKLHQSNFIYKQIGNTPPFKESRDNTLSTVSAFDTESYKITTQSGVVFEMNKRHAAIARNGNKYPQDQIRDWLPKEGIGALVDGATWKTSYNFNNPSVCAGTIKSDAISKSITYPIKIDGKNQPTQAFEIKLDGRGSCNGFSWKTSLTLVFSKELNTILSSDFLNFDPQGFLASSGGGSGYQLISLETSK